MHVVKGAARLFLATSAIAICAVAEAGETTTYTYDALGRLVATSSTGTVNDGVATSIGYDPAGNRSTYAVTGAGGSAPPPPPPPPPSSNNPPVANADDLMVLEWDTGLVDVVANDTDPEGNYPLALASISDPSGYAYVASTTSVGWSGAPAGTYTVTYTVKDSLGAAANGTLTVYVEASVICGDQICE